LKPWKGAEKTNQTFTIIEGLKTCKIPTLHYLRRIRGDMIETYKILTGKDEPCVAPILRKGSV